jgi:hypothetical protein
VAVASLLYSTNAVHMFFLAAPIWLVTALCYLVLAGLGGARTTPPASDTPERSAPPRGESRNKQGTRRAARPAWVWAAGVVAAVALLVAFALPLRAFAAGLADHEQLAGFHYWLAWVSVVHLVAVAVWVLGSEERGESTPAET